MPSENYISLPEKIVAVIDLVQEIPCDKIRKQLVGMITELINKDFQALLQLLYRIDVDEKKIRLYLAQNTNEDSAFILADLIIERQLQKIESKKQFNETKPRESDEEKW